MTATGPRYPAVKVELSEYEGNFLAILLHCLDRARRGGVIEDEQRAFFKEATAGGYEHLIQTCMKWFDVT